MSKIIANILVFGLLLSLGSPLMAQNYRKELNKLMKEMPEDLQQQIVDYAKRKQKSYEIAQKKLDTKAVEAEKLVKEKAEKTATLEVQPKPAPLPPKTPQTPQEKAMAMPQTSVEWAEEVFDYGTVVQGKKVTHTFKFKNTGDNPLNLTRVKASCGCTVPSYSKEPIAPGKNGEINVTFNSAGKMGRQIKTVTVTGNFPGQRKVLRIQGVIEAKTPTEK
ncbi:MAG: DUF1573 domain-containing protein [Bacteroidia bacterium]|nr:DUF1573 domain-containing protein [Bacteroidia bacterium]